MRYLRIILPFLVIIISISGYFFVGSMMTTTEPIQSVDTLKKVDVISLTPQEYSVTLFSHGEVKPVESTLLSADVSGSITYINPALIAGGIVEQGGILVSIDKREYQTAVLSAEAQLLKAESEYAKQVAMAKVAQNEVVRNPEKKFTKFFLRKPQLKSSEANLISARANFKQAKINLAKCDIKSVFDALVVSRNVGLGQVVTRNTELARLDNINHAEIIIPISGVDRKFLPSDIKGTQVNVYVQDRIVNGRIVRELGRVDADTRAIHLVVNIQSPYLDQAESGGLQFGDFVKVSFKSRTLYNIYRVPQHLVNGNKVWLADTNNRMISKNVEVLRKDGEYFYIDKGLNINERLVLTLPEYPVNGMKVDVVAHMSDEKVTVNQEHLELAQ